MLPQSIESEAAAISCLCQWPKESVAMMVQMGITREFFHIPAHRTIALAVMEMVTRGIAVDFATLSAQLGSDLPAVGGISFIAEIFTAIPTGANLRHYLEVISDRHVQREVIRISTEYAARSYESDKTVGEFRAEYIAEVTKLAHIGHKANKPRIGEIVMAVLNERQKAAESGQAVMGLTTYLPELDEAIGGLQSQDVIIIASKRGGGKTVYMLNCAEGCVIHHKRPALILSCEMPAKRLVQRLIAFTAQVNLHAMQNNRLNAEDERKVQEAATKIANSPLTIDDTPRMTINEICGLARAWKANNPKGGLVCVDYLQLIRTKFRKDRSRENEVAEISSTLKQLAKELDVPVIVGSQLNNQGITRESEAIENDADVMLAIEHEDEDSSSIVIEKCRNGESSQKRRDGTYISKVAIPVFFDRPRMAIFPRKEEEEEKPKKGRKKSVDI